MLASVKLDAVNLHYPSQGYRESSFKAFVFKALTGKIVPRLRDVHALKDVTLALGPRDRLALLGHNGAGKTSLLKTIAGIYPVSSGRLAVDGRVRALFELSLGFEPEATGRENILYRGLLLGKSPRQMRALEPEIVAFAELGEFIDYPVKTYSAGMLVRLAFSISTAIEGEILLMDEVIGVGDARFLQKARERIRQLVDRAAVMVLASHDLAAVRELCNRAVVLHQGAVVCDGPVEEAIAAYHRVMGLPS